MKKQTDNAICKFEKDIYILQTDICEKLTKEENTQNTLLLENNQLV